MSEWREVELGDVITLQRGYDLPQRDRRPGDIPVVSSSGISGYHDEAKVKAPGVVTGRYGTLGEAYYIEEDFWPHNTTLFAKDFHGNYPRFAYYLLGSLNLSNRSAVSAVPGLNRNDLHRLPVSLPPLPTQRRIAQILGRLDDKIEVNRRINRTLEAMAQALFKHHFVEFGPYQNGPFVDSDLGPIPQGWKVGTLGQIARNIKNGIDPTTLNPTTPYIGLADMPQGSITLDTWGAAGESISEKNVMNKGQILFGKLRPYFKKVGVVPIDGVCSTDILVIEPKNKDFLGLVLCQLSDQDFIDYTTAVSSGTRMPRVSWNMMGKYQIALPPSEIAKRFSNKVQQWSEIIVHNTLESRKLAEIRDYLLPRLLSGEIEV